MMIKILWNQCEAETKRATQSFGLAAQQGYGGPALTETVQCDRPGEVRTFADGATALICEQHWHLCTGIVDKDGAKHMRPAEPKDVKATGRND
jgi:hypothetical protein